ncbi:tetratricopeptide repeat protein [Luteolibacter sp. SL250]|uniref:tetratricopeptide repeat protein n=1 Tax=Luteolibacter sp. SL250 TaxID=2995170 RepID=UPI002270C48E|nr:tetratricopeptide repeat protein [Luteolibacter sp. SL250]WAC20116.1 tetratricopeptide repeat protein [Luteolibacter sp. SL250]
MPGPEAKAAVASKAPIFPIACWAMGIVGFSQLVIAGMSLAERLEASKQVRIVEKEVTKIVPVEVPAKRPDRQDEASIVARPPVAPAPPPPVVPAPEPTPIAAPAIADPLSERLVKEARKARVAGDIMAAITKLDEALKQSPDDPSVHYELGLMHETMGTYYKASAHYERVFQMGVSGAGALYELAAAKLRDGFEQPGDALGKLALGRVRIFKDTRVEKGERVILTIPVQKGPDAAIDPAEISVEVEFFNRNSKGEIMKAIDSPAMESSKDEWPSMPIDFAGGEEPLRVTYAIQPQEGATGHLFGQEKYYGQIVSLFYKGEILDVQAWPRDLLGRAKAQPAQQMPVQEPSFDQLPPDINYNAPLLPTLEVPPIESLPPLPGN